MRRAVEASLRRLRTDRIDLYYYHEPDGVTPLAETLGALGELADEGKIRAFGVSNLDAAQLREAAAQGDERLAALQNEYSLLERDAEAEVLPLCREPGSASSRTSRSPAACSPASSGAARRRPRARAWPARPERLDDAAFDRVEALEAFARERGHSAARARDRRAGLRSPASRR